MTTATKDTAIQVQNAFDPSGLFSSPSDALCQIYKQPEPILALLALVEAQVRLEECGFASEVVRDFNSFTAKEPVEVPVDLKTQAPQEVDIGGIIEINFDEPFGSGYKVHGPADDDRYTKRNIPTKEQAVEMADGMAQQKANDLGDKVIVHAYINLDPIRSEVDPE